ncbi:hypothetical protein F5Y08DRAFT_302492 [Xylaria arbuscula]|nr:hypothetical protein F5Y08DRAFT_302492 [Xylaria arbuscula]
MMPSVYGASVAQTTPHTFTNQTIIDEYASQQPAFPDSSRRISRPANGQWGSGPMRVVKPSSANNSPQSMMPRRRTLMNDSNMARRRQQALDQAILQHMQERSTYYTNPQETVRQNTRPVSWHPSSHLPTAPQMQMPISQLDYHQFAMDMPTPYNTKEYFAGYQNLPPTPAAYSGHTSPVSGFSPLLPYESATQPNVLPSYMAAAPAVSAAPSCFQPNGTPDAVCDLLTYQNQTSYDWETYASHGLQSCTAPPTPDEFQGAYEPQSMPSEESIPYQPLEEPEAEEDEGEILVGMGLYDQPSKVDTDPELDHYRTTTSRFLDTIYRSGKGWKLEEAWEPPATDDEEDADGEDQEEDSKSTESPPAQQSWI